MSETRSFWAEIDETSPSIFQHAVALFDNIEWVRAMHGQIDLFQPNPSKWKREATNDFHNIPSQNRSFYPFG